MIFWLDDIYIIIPEVELYYEGEDTECTQGITVSPELIMTPAETHASSFGSVDVFRLAWEELTQASPTLNKHTL